MGSSHSTEDDGRIQNVADVPVFTDREKDLLRSSWDKLSVRTEFVAMDIFLQIFKIRPDVKRFFPFENAVGDALVSHPYFKGHAMLFINAIKMAIVNLDAWEVILIPNLVQLGHFHTRIDGFTHDVFQVFYQAMNNVWAKHLGRSVYSGKLKTAWCKIFQFIIDKVEQGYQEGLEAKAKTGPHEEKTSNCPEHQQKQPPP